MATFLLRFEATRPTGFDALVAAVAAFAPGLDASRLVAELSQPPPLPSGDDVVRSDVGNGVVVSWHENDPQEKVSRYHYAYISAGDVRLWAANFVSAPMFEKEMFVWCERAAWDVRDAIAAALAPHGFVDDSARTLLPWVMTQEHGERRDAFVACYPKRRVIEADWIGAEYLSDDFHFPQTYRCAWREAGGRVVDGSWLRSKHAPHASLPALDAWLSW